MNVGKEKEEKAWEGYGEFNFETDYSSPTIEEAEKILRESGVELKEDGTNAEQVGSDPDGNVASSTGAVKDTEAKGPVPRGLQGAGPELRQHLHATGYASAADGSRGAESRIIPTSFGGQNDEMFIAIGIAEGTRTPSGGYTKAWSGHTDPVIAASIAARSPADVALGSARLRLTGNGEGSWPRPQSIQSLCCSRSG